MAVSVPARCERAEMIVVAGGGLAGAAAAATLARAGVAVKVIEREAAPGHRICGEFLSGEARSALEAIGFDPGALGGHGISRLRLARGDRVVETALPFTGIGVTRRRLDAALLDHAAACGAMVERGMAVRGVVDGPGRAVLRADGTREPASAVLLATGKHAMRGFPRGDRLDRRVGFKTYFRLAPGQAAELASHVELAVFGDAYVGLQLVEDGMANLALLASAERVRRAGGFEGLLAGMASECRLLGARLDGAEAVLSRPLSIAQVPYGYVHRPGPEDPDFVYRLGDQAAVIPSFTGDGMAIALHSAALAVAVLRRGGDARDYHAAFRRKVRFPVGLASAIDGLMRRPATREVLFGAAQRFPALLRAGAMRTRVARPVAA